MKQSVVKPYLCFKRHSQGSSEAVLNSTSDYWWLSGWLTQWNPGCWRHFTKAIMALVVDDDFREWRLRRRAHGWLVQSEECGCQQGPNGQRQRRRRCWGETVLDWTHLGTNQEMERGTESDEKMMDKKRYGHSFSGYLITMSDMD